MFEGKNIIYKKGYVIESSEKRIHEIRDNVIPLPKSIIRPAAVSNIISSQYDRPRTPFSSYSLFK